MLDLRAGDRVLLSGTIYTSRDEAHLKIREEGFPFDPKGAVIYHCGPVIDEAQNKVVAAGPTTSARMNDLTGYMLDAGVRGLIGKGGMSEIVRTNSVDGRSILPSPGDAPLSPLHAWNWPAVIIRNLGWQKGYGRSN